MFGAADGQLLAGDAVSVVAGANFSATEDVLVDAVSLPEPHAASVRANGAARVARMTAEYMRGEFTVVTLQPHCAALATAVCSSPEHSGTSFERMDTYSLGPFTVRRIDFGAMQLPGAGVFGAPRNHDEAVACGTTGAAGCRLNGPSNFARQSKTT